jgi:aconitate hydratase
MRIISRRKTDKRLYERRFCGGIKLVQLIDHDVYCLNGETILELQEGCALNLLRGRTDRGDLPLDITGITRGEARKNTIAYRILMDHQTDRQADTLKIRFDALASHDITYVGIVQTARASGLREFPVPYVLTNCHNSLCAVGGTINEDDHLFGLSAAQKYGGIYVPAHQAVIHQYVREMMTACGSMILGSDSHTRYGALGTMGIGEGGPELVKQLLQKSYDLTYPEIVGVYLEGRPQNGVGPQDVALAIIGAVFKNGFVKNKVLEFIGPGIKNLSVDYRNGIDVMTTETACLSSIWTTDAAVGEYYEIHGRPDCYAELKPGAVACYDGLIIVDLDQIEPMIALPFHPSNVYTVSELNSNPYDILRAVEEEGKRQVDNPAIEFSLLDKIVDGRLRIDQGLVAGCAGGSFENLCAIASIIENHPLGNGSFSLGVYPASQPIYYELIKNDLAARMMSAGIVIKTAFCGPCFGASDTPASGSLSIRHTTRNFPFREGAKPDQGQVALVALADARTIAATAINGGFLTPATSVENKKQSRPYAFNGEIYSNRVYNGFGRPNRQEELKFGPNIADWPKMSALPQNLLLKVVSVITDPVTTTDELIPSGETSSYRSNPLRLAEFTLSRKDPQYVARAKGIQALEQERQNSPREAGKDVQISDALRTILANVRDYGDVASLDDLQTTTGIGSVICAVRPGDGSAREQAASCQRVLGGSANIAVEYATKRYRSNLINWGLLPLTTDADAKYEIGDLIFLPGVRSQIEAGSEVLPAKIIGADGVRDLRLYLKNLSPEERAIILAGCLINYYTNGLES